MFRVIEGFEGQSINDIWVMTTTTNYPVAGRVGGRALLMTSEGFSFFMNVMMLPESFSHGTLNIAVDMVDQTHSLSMIFFNGTQEQYRLTLSGRGSIQVTGFGREIIKTGGSVFQGTQWNGFEFCFKDHSLSVAVNDRTVMIAPNVYANFDRVAFAIPDNQKLGVKIDDIAFNDDPVLSGDKVVLVMSENGLPYLPAEIWAVKKDGIQSSNPSGQSWALRDMSKFVGDLVLVSRKSISTDILHSVVAQ